MVLKVEDLRAGGLFKVQIKKRLRMVSIAVIYRNYKIIYDILPNYIPVRADIYKLIPIELNDAEMDSMGFKLFDGDGELKGDSRYWMHPLLDGSISYRTHRYEYQHNLKLKYLHELQNFMFAVVSKDIIYKYRANG